MNRRFNSGLDSSYLGMHVCNSFLEVVLFWIREHFVEVGFRFGGFCMAGIRNAGPVLGLLQRIC